MHEARLDILHVLYHKRTAKALIRLRGYEGRPALLLLSCIEVRFSGAKVHFNVYYYASRPSYAWGPL